MDIQRILSIKNTTVQDEFLAGLSSQDPTHPYYGFLYDVVKLVKPELTIELGVCTGRGTAHLAGGYTNGKVIGVDPTPWPIQYIMDIYPNISIVKDRSDAPSLLASIRDESVDICLFDTIHEYGQIKMEFELWYPKMKLGGVMLFDDITMNDGMKKFWNEVKSEKAAMPELHWSGFGVAIK